MPIYDAAMRYQQQGIPSVVFGGEEYGTGSSRDWAAKGTQLLGIKAVIAKSFERIHRSNLVGMGVLPLQLMQGDGADTLGIKGDETFDIAVPKDIKPQQRMNVTMRRADGTTRDIPVVCRIDTPIEVDYYRHGGILPFVLRDLLQPAA
jgi:aconitate hydratase